MNKSKQPKKSALDLAKDALAVDAKNREQAAMEDYNKSVADIKAKYGVSMIHSGQYLQNQIKHFISFQANPISVQNQS